MHFDDILNGGLVKMTIECLARIIDLLEASEVIAESMKMSIATAFALSSQRETFIALFSSQYISSPSILRPLHRDIMSACAASFLLNLAPMFVHGTPEKKMTVSALLEMRCDVILRQLLFWSRFITWFHVNFSLLGTLQLQFFESIDCAGLLLNVFFLSPTPSLRLSLFLYRSLSLHLSSPLFIFSYSIKTHASILSESQNHQTVKQLGDLASEAFLLLANRVQQGLWSPMELQRALKDEDDVCAAWAALGVPNMREYLQLGHEDQLQLHQLAYRLHSVADALIPQSRVLRALVVVTPDSFWQAVPYTYLTRFFRFSPSIQLLSLPTSTQILCPDCLSEPLPEELVSGLSWLEYIYQLPWFLYVWNKVNHETKEFDLSSASVLLCRYMQQMTDGSLSFENMSHFSDILPQEADLVILLRATEGFLGSPLMLDNPEAGTRTALQSAAGIAESASRANKWTIAHANSLIQTTAVALASQLSLFAHMNSVYVNRSRVEASLVRLKPFLKASAVKEVDELVGKLKYLTSEVSVQWSSLCLKDLARFSAGFTVFEKNLVRVDPSMLDVVEKSCDLLNWLRLCSNDADFTSSVEIALSKAEMECPIELWEPGKDAKAGRPDEKKLSMLSNVRAFFHKYIFRVMEVFDSVHEAVEVFSNIENITEELTSQVVLCNKLRLAFMELLDGSSESSATERLVQLMLPNRQASWHIQFDGNMKSNGESGVVLAGEDSYDATAIVRLNFVVPRAESTHHQSQTFSQLLDFQR